MAQYKYTPHGEDNSHLIDLTDKPDRLEAEILGFVAGIRGPRKNEVTMREIRKWFHGTPPTVIYDAVNDLVGKGRLIAFRTGPGSSGRGYVYGVNPRK